ncbi:hypothetical protein [Derxia lacustris]|uniref:hypothetical protein n=1 Tax=Derxia lacustris TaxID=764842 RepID=UPI000A172EB2|nr:hypothetical protein [Derxia lacustris]
MKSLVRKAALGLALAGLAALAHAADDDSHWKFSGFGTLGAVVTNTDEAQFRTSPRQPNGADRRPDLGVDSRLGLQASAALDETFSAVGQLLTSRRDGDERVQVEWLFAQAAVAPWLDLRIGRMVLPAFLVSDSRNVGYASHWVRAPGDVYGIYPATSYDGVQAELRGDWRDSHITLQASGGKSRGRAFLLGQSLEGESDGLRSLNLVVERGNWTLRAGRTCADAHLRYTQTQQLSYADHFSGLGLARDDGRLLLQAELVWRRTSDRGLDSNNGYVTGGYRFGPWMPYATVSRNIYLGRWFGDRPSISNHAAGLRWDGWRNAALKTQLESAHSDGATFAHASPAFMTGHGHATVLTVLVDFVF